MWVLFEHRNGVEQGFEQIGSLHKAQQSRYSQFHTEVCVLQNSDITIICLNLTFWNY